MLLGLPVPGPTHSQVESLNTCIFCKSHLLRLFTRWEVPQRDSKCGRPLEYKNAEITRTFKESFEHQDVKFLYRSIETALEQPIYDGHSSN